MAKVKVLKTIVECEKEYDHEIWWTIGSDTLTSEKSVLRRTKIRFYMFYETLSD